MLHHMTEGIFLFVQKKGGREGQLAWTIRQPSDKQYTVLLCGAVKLMRDTAEISMQVVHNPTVILLHLSLAQHLTYEFLIVAGSKALLFIQTAFFTIELVSYKGQILLKEIYVMLNIQQN